MLNEKDRQFLLKLLNELLDHQGSAGCNDLILPASPANVEYLNRVFEYGVSRDLWDKDCSPEISGDNIVWYDTMLTSYMIDKLDRMTVPKE